MDIQDIHEFEGGPEPIWYMARGHVDKVDFTQAVKEKFGTEIDPEKVEHMYIRSIPMGEMGPMLVVSKKGRGAYPATVIDLLI